MAEDARSYHLRRAAMEDRLAAAAADPGTAQAHRILGDLHRQRADASATPTLSIGI